MNMEMKLSFSHFSAWPGGIYISKHHEGTKIALFIWIPTPRDPSRDAHRGSLTDYVLISQ
ncbi:hypothetical protein MKX08_004156 [Trichoderma sp. CBMAI-0020]|nr:hypothetical protein MKX08_004156 [Trichoderma sp. CBMAI-0020]